MQKIINAETLAGVYTGNFRKNKINFVYFNTIINGGG